MSASERVGTGVGVRVSVGVREGVAVADGVHVGGSVWRVTGPLTVAKADVGRGAAVCEAGAGLHAGKNISKKAQKAVPTV